jgi:hypothetical protein
MDSKPKRRRYDWIWLPLVLAILIPVGSLGLAWAYSAGLLHVRWIDVNKEVIIIRER